MRARTFALLALAAAAIPGCVVTARAPAHGQVAFHEHHYLYYPSCHAYHCTVHDHWFVREHGDWVQWSVRPAPYVRYETHVRDYPDDWHPGRGKGPPPGRGWRK